MQDEEFPFGEAFLGVGRFTFRAGYMQPRYDGASTLTRDFVFNGQTFTAGDTIVSRLDVTMIDGQVQFDLLRPGVGVAGFAGEARAASTAAEIDAKVDAALVLLYLDDVSYREMAEVLGLSESNVGVKLNRAKHALAERMKEVTYES